MKQLVSELTAHQHQRRHLGSYSRIQAHGGPCWPESLNKFRKRLFQTTSKLPDLNRCHIIIGADLNCAVDPVLRYSNPKTFSPSKMAQAFSIHGFFRSLQIFYPQQKVYSYFSHVLLFLLNLCLSMKQRSNGG